MKRYIALIYQEPDGSYCAKLPDLPGLIVISGTIGDARVEAGVALSDHVRRLEAEGEAIPKPSGFERIIAEHRDALENMSVALIGIDA
jgi:predicted RNase H-like HicB family nuclease